MQFNLIAILTLAIASISGATRQARSESCTCHRHRYSDSETQAAIDQGESGTFRGYPHEYHDFEGFSFSCGGSTYYEFPILTTGEVFDGSTSPGPDRVIFDDSADFCGCVTHTGASGDKFKQCSN